MEQCVVNGSVVALNASFSFKDEYSNAEHTLDHILLLEAEVHGFMNVFPQCDLYLWGLCIP